MCTCVCSVASVMSHGLQPPRLLCPWDSPGKDTGVGCHALLQGIFPTQGSNMHLLHWQADSLSLHHLETLLSTRLYSNFSYSLIYTKNSGNFKCLFSSLPLVHFNIPDPCDAFRVCSSIPNHVNYILLLITLTDHRFSYHLKFQTSPVFSITKSFQHLIRILSLSLTL